MAQKKKPEVYDFNHDDGLASQMTDERMEKSSRFPKKAGG